MSIEETEEYKTWGARLEKLNDYINSLSVWDNYAEQKQAEYDSLLRQDPRLK